MFAFKPLNIISGKDDVSFQSIDWLRRSPYEDIDDMCDRIQNPSDREEFTADGREFILKKSGTEGVEALHTSQEAYRHALFMEIRGTWHIQVVGSSEWSSYDDGIVSYEFVPDEKEWEWDTTINIYHDPIQSYDGPHQSVYEVEREREDRYYVRLVNSPSTSYADHVGRAGHISKEAGFQPQNKNEVQTDLLDFLLSDRYWNLPDSIERSIVKYI